MYHSASWALPLALRLRGKAPLPDRRAPRPGAHTLSLRRQPDIG